MKNLVITILAVIVLGLGGYLVFDKILSNNNTDNENNKMDNQNNVVLEELDINSKEVQDLFAPFNYYLDASKEELYPKDKITTSDLSNEYKNRLAFAKYWNENRKYEGTENVDSILLNKLTSSTLGEYYKKVFGTGVQYAPISFNSYHIASLEMTYDSQKNIYIASQNAGEVATFRYGTELYKAIKKGNTIELYEYVVVFNYNWDKKLAGVYRNISDAINFQNAIKETISSDLTVLMKYYDYEGIKDNLS